MGVSSARVMDAHIPLVTYFTAAGASIAAKELHGPFRVPAPALGFLTALMAKYLVLVTKGSLQAGDRLGFLSRIST